MQQVTGLSNAILAGAGAPNPYNSNAPTGKDPRGPSFVNRVIDIMSRPLYATLNPLKKELEENKGKTPQQSIVDSLDMLSPITKLDDMWAGLSGKDKTTGRDIINAAGGKDLPGAAKFGIGLGIDIAADPLTYTGIGLLPKLGKAAKASTQGLAAVEQGAQEGAQSLAEQISRRAAQQSRDLATEIPTKGLPAPKPTDPPRIFQAGPGPNLPEVINEIPLAQPVRKPIAELASTPAPVPPNPALKALTEALESSRAGKTELKSLAPKLENADPLTALRTLNEQINVTKSPIAKSLLRKQAEKLQAGVKPADILSEARVTPPPFPELTIGPRWVEQATIAAQKFLKRNRMSNINHVGQTNLYNAIVNAASKVRKDRRAFTVLQMLRVAEEEVLSAGRKLVDAEGISVRLTDLVNLAGGPRAMTPKLVDDFRKARPSQQVEDLKAFTTPQVVTEILDPVVKTGADLADATKALPPSQTVMIGSDISRELGKIAEAAGASSREAKTAKAFVDDLFNPSRDRLYSPTVQEARNLVRMSATGKLDNSTLLKITEETYKGLGVNPKILGREMTQNKVVEGIMTKFATWWGAKDLKPFSREYIDTARNVAAAFAETITPLVRHTTPTARMKAWSVAQGKISASDPAEQALADQFKYMVERLMGTHGITDNSEAVLLRSASTLKELNEELPKSLRLTDRAIVDDLGNTIDYTNGQWMHSWKEWKVKEPAEALYQLTRALQMVTRKNSMWDDAAARWGMAVKGAEFQHQAQGVPRLQGIYFPKQIAEQITNLKKQLDRDVFKSPHKAIELFDKVQRMWKTGVTIYSPSHHIRNLNGDIYLAALDGVVSPRPYAIATKVLHAYPTRYKDLESVFNIMDPKLRESALRSRPGNVVLTTRRGEKVTAEQLYRAAESQGLFIRAQHIEDLLGENAPAFGTFGAKFQPFGGRVYGAATRVSELRDHWVRLAHFSDVLSKSNQPLRVAIEQAGRRVKKFHPDGMDLTGFEQNVLRRLIPFYSWMRKATPLVLEGMLMRPHITLAFPKTMANVQLATGIESEGPGDPFPMDQMFPDWIKEKGIGPSLMPGSGLGRDENWRGEAPGYTIINPTSPFMDQLSQIGKPGTTLTSALTPGLRVPIELMTGQTSLGIPLENVEGGVPGHLAQQIPAVGIGARLTGATRDNEPWNPEQLLNWLTSAGITGTGPYESQAQTEIRMMLQEMAKKNRGDYR
ncbi:MAG TPA: hypothetical protein VGD31_16760 [Sphingobacteriaceae bacterium]